METESYGKTTKPPAYLDEFAAQQWKAKAKQLADAVI
jgi:phage terminase small subunit